MNSKRSKISSSRISYERRESGIALIAVLWMLLMLSALAASVGYIARTNAMLAHRAAEVAHVEAAADAAIIETISILSDAQVSRHPATSGSSRGWEFDGAHVEVTVSKEAGRIDLNSADRELISAFLQSQGIDQNTATALIGELTNRSRSNDAIPLQSVDELREIPNWEAKNIDCWMDSLTVYTGLPGVSFADVPSKVLDALKWAQEHHFADREWITVGSASQSAVGQASVIGDVLRISAVATLSNDVTVTTVWIGRLTGDRQNPMLTYRWGHLRSTDKSSCSDSVA